MKKALLLLAFIIFSINLKAQKKTTQPTSVISGKLLYQKHCMTCHQVDGVGAQNMIPPLTKTSFVLGAKPALINIILKGMSGEIKVNGDIYDGEMPAQANLTDQEIALILSYVRNSFGNKASAISTIEVKKVRTNPKPKSNSKS